MILKTINYMKLKKILKSAKDVIKNAKDVVDLH